MNGLTIELAGRRLPALRLATPGCRPEQWPPAEASWHWTALVPLGESDQTMLVSLSGEDVWLTRTDRRAMRNAWESHDWAGAVLDYPSGPYSEDNALAQIVAWAS